jgi:transcriptional regulator with XRE-family HTH domain
MSQEQEEEVRRLLELLRTLMRMLGFSNREVERRMGVNHGSVSRVFNGVIEAKLELVLGAVRAIGLEYDEFFSFAYPELRPPETESPAARKIRSMLEDLRPLGRRPAFPVPQPEEAVPAGRPEPLNREELFEELKRAVREIMEEVQPAGEGGPKAGNGHE